MVNTKDSDGTAARANAGDDGGTLSGGRLRGLFATASTWLERNAQAINAINVFPVPDGDTGSNMAATLRDTIRTVGAGVQNAGEVSAAIARAALMSARGNSGVILSQLLRGFAEATDGMEHVDGRALARALVEAARTAYASIEHPVEGTILTVARAAGEAASAVRSTDPREVLEAALAEARNALARTPELLPMLKQAGVVDSGGFGFVVMLEGAVRYLRGEPLPDQAIDAGSLSRDWLDSAEAHQQQGSRYGYCTEFVILGDALDAAVVRGRVAALGDSVVVAGDVAAVHVHVHADDPGAALSFGTSLGRLTRIKIDNMQLQHEGFLEDAESAREAPAGVDAGAPAEELPFATVFVAVGEGLAAAARGLGATVVVHGGQTMNPSVEQILQAIKQAPSRQVIVLPNNGNVVLTAEQAVRLTAAGSGGGAGSGAGSNKDVRVVKSRSVPQGLAALLAFHAESDLDSNVAVMQEALGEVRTIEVTHAARSTRIGEIEVSEGQAIGLIDDRLVVAAASPEEALVEAVTLASPAPGSAVTLYYGEGVPSEDAAAAEERLRGHFPEAEIQTLRGGQPHYPYIASVE